MAAFQRSDQSNSTFGGKGGAQGAPRTEDGFHGLNTGAASNALEMNRSTIFDVDLRCGTNRHGGDDDLKLQTKPFNSNSRFINAVPPPLSHGKSFGASSFPLPPPSLPPTGPASPSKVQVKGEDEQVEIILTDLRKALSQRGAVGVSGLARNFRIVDTDRSGKLDMDELRKCLRLCKITLDDSDLTILFRHVDEDDSGHIDYDEFLKAVRGPMPPVRKRLVVDVFHAIDERARQDGKGKGDGQLTIDDISDLYDGKSHPEVKAGRMSVATVLQEMLKNFEGRSGNADGVVTLKEWSEYYGDLSASIENDDHFSEMLRAAWPALFCPKESGARGFAPLKPPIEKAKVDYLEELLKKAVTSRSSGSSETKALEKAFAQFDKDNSKEIKFDEFLKAMERFGLATSHSANDVSGVTVDTIRALFDRYDADGAGSLSYEEFVAGLFKEEAPAHVRAPKPLGAPPADYRVLSSDGDGP